MRARILSLVAALLSGTVAGCQSNQKPPSPPAAKAVATSESTTYKLKGKVRDVDAKTGVVTIAHEEIPGFMKAMTMDFTPKDRTILEDLGVGDEVEGPLEVTRVNGAIKNYDLLSLEVTQPAPRTLNLSGGGFTLTPKPAVLEPGEAVPDFEMTTQEGKKLKLADLKGKVTVLTFIYTRCPLPDYCPAVDKKFREIRNTLRLKQARSEGTRLLSVSFDPEHDTVESLQKHAEFQGANPPFWTFAVAAHPELAKIGPRLGLIYGPTPNEIRHNIIIAVIDRDGKLIKLQTGRAGMDWTSNEILSVINQEFTEKNK